MQSSSRRIRSSMNDSPTTSNAFQLLFAELGHVFSGEFVTVFLSDTHNFFR